MNLTRAFANLLDAITRRLFPANSILIVRLTDDRIDEHAREAMALLTPDDPSLPRARY